MIRPYRPLYVGGWDINIVSEPRRCGEMESRSQQIVRERTASSSQNSLTGDLAASSYQNSMTGGSSSKVSVTKRKRSVLTLEKKLEIVAESKKSKSVRSVSGQFDVPKSTVSDIWRGRQKNGSNCHC